MSDGQLFQTSAQTKMHRPAVLIQLRSVIARIINDGHTTPISITADEGNCLRDWVIREKPTHTIEIGLAYGVSALYICEGLLVAGSENSKHLVIDPFQTGFKNHGLQLLQDAGVGDLIEFHAEESQILLPRLLGMERKFEFAFVDGSHLFERVFLDLVYLGRLVKPGCIVFVDDYQLPAIARAVSFCITNLKWVMEELSAPDEEHQWVVLRLPRETVSRNFRDFIEF